MGVCVQECKRVSAEQKSLCTLTHEHADEKDRSVIVRDSLASAVGEDGA